MQATDAADQIKEVRGAEAAEDTGLHKFENQAALLIAFLAMFLAVTSVAGSDNEQVILQSEIQASNTFAFYQAKTIRRTNTMLTRDQTRILLAGQGADWSLETRAGAEERLAFWANEIDRYQNEPEEGTRDLLAKGQALQETRDRAMQKDPNFDFAEGLFQIAIVIASVAIITKIRPLLAGSAIMGLVALILLLNGFLLFTELPF